MRDERKEKEKDSRKDKMITGHEVDNSSSESNYDDDIFFVTITLNYVMYLSDEKRSINEASRKNINCLQHEHQVNTKYRYNLSTQTHTHTQRCVKCCVTR